MRAIYNIAAICVGAALTTASHASELPRYDVEAHCTNVAAMGGNSSAMIKNGCMAMEQRGYDKIKPEWPNLPDAMKKHCLDVAEFGGGGSYSTLSGCITMEQRSASKPQQFKY